MLQMQICDVPAAAVGTPNWDIESMLFHGKTSQALI